MIGDGTYLMGSTGELVTARQERPEADRARRRERRLPVDPRAPARPHRAELRAGVPRALATAASAEPSSRSTTPPTRAASAAPRSRADASTSSRDALDAARAKSRARSVIVARVEPRRLLLDSDCWWDVGVPEALRAARDPRARGRARAAAGRSSGTTARREDRRHRRGPRRRARGIRAAGRDRGRRRRATARARGREVLIVRGTRLDAATLARAPPACGRSRAPGAGYDNLDVDAATRLRRPDRLRARASGSQPVAEGTVALILAAAKRLRELGAVVHEHGAGRRATRSWGSTSRAPASGWSASASIGRGWRACAAALGHARDRPRSRWPLDAARRAELVAARGAARSGRT